LWRDLGKEGPSDDTKGPGKEELCHVPISDIDAYLKAYPGWTWDQLDGRWRMMGKGGDGIRPKPGMELMFESSNGGYNTRTGWTGSGAKKPVKVPEVPVGGGRGGTLPSMERELETATGRWVPLGEHLDAVAKEVTGLSGMVSLQGPHAALLATAARWHDVGKSHSAFQQMMVRDRLDRATLLAGGPWAKSDRKGTRARYSVVLQDGTEVARPYFRHELASALAWLQKGGKEGPDADLVAYLIAAHHGKIRMSIRSLPKENEPPIEGQLFARGIWDGDELPQLPGLLPSIVKLDLSLMRMGEGSWLERSLGMRDSPDLGPFRVGYLEALLRVADWRVSRAEEGG